MANKYGWNNGEWSIEVEANSFKEAFGDISTFQEIVTIKNPKTDAPIRLRQREVDGNNYYELVDTSTGESFALGQKKKGNQLFPRWKDKDGNPQQWRKWADVQDDDEEETPKKKK